jgi:hypothetical protein
MEQTFRRQADFVFIEEEEVEAKHASEVPFEFAVVAVCEDDFGRVWLSALELRTELIEDEYQVEGGRFQVFRVPTED